VLWSAAMSIYTLRSFSMTGRIIAVQRLYAETDAEALSMASDMVAAASAGFDLWEAERHIHGASTPKGKPRR